MRYSRPKEYHYLLLLPSPTADSPKICFLSLIGGRSREEDEDEDEDEEEEEEHPALADSVPPVHLAQECIDFQSYSQQITETEGPSQPDANQGERLVAAPRFGLWFAMLMPPAMINEGVTGWHWAARDGTRNGDDSPYFRNGQLKELLDALSGLKRWSQFTALATVHCPCNAMEDTEKDDDRPILPKG
ncbi:hypothetical protein Tco_1110203 [Tanacetum coccineum]|uniref:Uncharacterized protein n=1 Tax=Tanacetum coccineum TaxID=301880 RepID=A0ABQ5II78_9ASTR